MSLAGDHGGDGAIWRLQGHSTFARTPPESDLNFQVTGIRSLYPRLRR
jgi:hypothetical protein